MRIGRLRMTRALSTLAVLVATLLLIGVASPGLAVQAQVAPEDGPALVVNLRAGGFILLFRHAATDAEQKDTDRQHLENCATQRNLSEAGRQQAARIGEELRRLQVPLKPVLASPYCRTLDTARLAFGEASVTPTNDLVSQQPDDPEGRQRLTASLRSMLAQAPEPGSNTVLVTHWVNIEDATQADLAEGEAVLVRPDGQGGFSLGQKVSADAWASFQP